jgi:cytosine/uracil/thiamine/allantoin permease
MSVTITDSSPRLINEDLAPAENRNWGLYSLFAM